MSQFEEANSDDDSLNDWLRSDFMDPDTEQRVDRPADSWEEFGIDPMEGSQAPAPTPPLGQTQATSIGDSDAQRNIGENNEGARRQKKRMADKKYRDGLKKKREELEDENGRLKQELLGKNHEVDQLKAENASLKCELKGNSEKWKQITKSLLDHIGVGRERQVFNSNTQPLLAPYSSSNPMVDEFPQNIIPRPYILIDRGFQADATTPPLSQLPGTSRMQQTFQSPVAFTGDSHGSPNLWPDAITLPQSQLPGTSRMQQKFQSPVAFTGDSHGSPNLWPQEQLGQTAHSIDGLPEFSLNQGQGGNSTIESQPFTQGPSDQHQLSSENFGFDVSRFRPMPGANNFGTGTGAGSQNFGPGSGAQNFGPGAGGQIYGRISHYLGFSPGSRAQNSGTWFGEKALGRSHARSTVQTIILGVLAAENSRLKHEDQQMKSKIEALKVEHTRLTRESEEKEQLIKSYLEAFEAEIGRLMREIEKEKQIMKNNRPAFETENGQLKHEIEEKERLKKSNMEGYEVKNGKLKLEIGEKEQPMKSNLESLEAENGRLKSEIEQKELLMQSNLKAFEGQNGRLKHEVQAEDQLMKSNLETREAQIRQLVDEFESLNVAIVAVNPRMQTHQGN